MRLVKNYLHWRTHVMFVKVISRWRLYYSLKNKWKTRFKSNLFKKYRSLTVDPIDNYLAAISWVCCGMTACMCCDCHLWCVTLVPQPTIVSMGQLINCLDDIDDDEVEQQQQQQSLPSLPWLHWLRGNLANHCLADCLTRFNLAQVFVLLQLLLLGSVCAYKFVYPSCSSSPSDL